MEIKNLHTNTPEENLVLDICTMALDFGESTNVEYKNELIEIPHTILPHRRNGKFLCLPHRTEGLINVGGIEKWAKGETTARNERRYVLEMQQDKIDYKNDGLSTLKYELVNIEQLDENSVMINVKL
jgi:hypothetical protein